MIHEVGALHLGHRTSRARDAREGGAAGAWGAARPRRKMNTPRCVAISFKFRQCLMCQGKIEAEEFDQKHARHKHTQRTGHAGRRAVATGARGKHQCSERQPSRLGMETMRFVRHPVPWRREQIGRVASHHAGCYPPPPRPWITAPRPRPSAAAAPAVPVYTVIGRAPVLRIPSSSPELPVRDGVGHRKRKMCATFNSRHPTTISPSAGTSSLDLLAEGAAFG